MAKVREMFAGKCGVCRCVEMPDGFRHQCHHIISRTFKHLEFELMNGIMLCTRPPSGCHAFVHDTANGKDWLEKDIKRRLPAWGRWIDEARKQANMRTRPFTHADLVSAIEKLEATDVESL